MKTIRTGSCIPFIIFATAMFQKNYVRFFLFLLSKCRSFNKLIGGVNPRKLELDIGSRTHFSVLGLWSEVNSLKPKEIQALMTCLSWLTSIIKEDPTFFLIYIMYLDFPF